MSNFKYIIIAFLLIINFQAIAQVANYGNTDIANSSLASSLTISSFTANAETDRLLVAYVGYVNGGSVSSITFNGQNLTKARFSSTSGVRLGIYYLELGTGADITSDVVLTLTSAGQNIRFGVATFKDIDQADPTGVTGLNSGNSSSISLSLSGDEDDAITDLLYSGGSVTMTSGANQTDVINSVLAGSNGFASSLQTISTSPTSMNWTKSGSSSSTIIGVILNCASCVPLPVDLIFFKGQATPEGNHLTWQTASEENNHGFFIEKSEDGETWEILDFIEGNGTTLVVSDYEYFDRRDVALQRLYPQRIYYRLKQVDFDGQYEYSEIITIISSNHQQNEMISIFPNPATDYIQINSTQEDGFYQIYTYQGQSLQEGNITNNRIALQNLPNGKYLVVMTFDNLQIQQPLIVHH